jgi:hypothetical protein
MKTKKPKTKKADTGLKPPMPEKPITQPLTVPLDVKLLLDTDRFSSGALSITLGDTKTNIVNTETNKKLGHVIACLGGGIEIVVGKRHWRLAPLELWKAVQKADESYRKAALAGEYVDEPKSETAGPQRKRRGGARK